MKKSESNGNNNHTTVEFLRANEREITIRTSRDNGEVVETIARVVPPKKRSGQEHSSVSER